MLLSEFLLPFDDCVQSIDEMITTFDLIPSFKAILIKTYLMGPADEWEALTQEWPNVTRMLREHVESLVRQYEDYDMVEMALEELALRYDREAKNVQFVLKQGLQM